MTRSQKYDVNSAGDHQVTSVNMESTKEQYSFNSNSSTNPVLTVVDPFKPKTRFIPWIALILVGVCAACFLGIMYGNPNSPVHLRGTKASFSRNITVQGGLVLYPQIPGFNSNNRLPYEYFINLDDSYLDFNYNLLSNVTSVYSNHISDEPPPEPYVHCWLETPSRQKPCFFDKGWLGRSCLASNRFGYRKEPNESHINPCFLVRIENSGSWAPENLKPDDVVHKVERHYDPSFVGLECKPKDARQNHVTVVQNPIKGFPLQFFPMDSFESTNYVLPAVMLRVYGIRENENVTIECFLYARDSYHLKGTGKMQVTLFHPINEIIEVDPRDSRRVGSESDLTTTPEYISEIPQQTSEVTTEEENYYSYPDSYSHGVSSSKLEVIETEPILEPITSTEDTGLKIA